MKLLSRLEEIRLPLGSDADVRLARLAGRMLMADLGFTSSDATIVATVISELGRNVVRHAGRGEITLSTVDEGSRRGLSISACYQGPGIPDADWALGLAQRLWGAKRLMDEFEVVSEVDQGTTITVKKWKG